MVPNLISVKSSFQLNGRGHDCALGWYRTLLCRHNNLYITRCNLDVAPDNSPYITSQSPSEQKQMSLKENPKRECSRHNNFCQNVESVNKPGQAVGQVRIPSGVVSPMLCQVNRSEITLLFLRWQLHLEEASRTISKTRGSSDNDPLINKDRN